MMNILTILMSISILIILISEARNITLRLTTFLLISILVVGLTGVYSWITKIDHIDTLTHIHSTDWAEHYSFSQITSHQSNYLIDSEENLHVIWTEYDQQSNLIHLKHLIANSRGETIHPPKIILKNKHIQQIASEFINDEIHIFWIGQGDLQKIDLNYTQVDLNSQIKAHKVILTDLFDHSVKELKLTSTVDNFMLSWIEKERSFLQVKSLLINSSGEIKNGPITLSTPKYNSSHLNLVCDQTQQFHLLWREERSSKTSHLYYQRIDQEGHAISTPRLLDQGQIGLNTITYANEKLYLAWGKTIKDQTKVSLIYGTIIDLKRPEQELKISELSKPKGSATNPSLAQDSSGQIYLTYIQKKLRNTSIAYQIFNDQFDPVIDRPKWMFSKKLYPTEMHLLTDSKGNLHLYWFDTMNDKSLQYTNNIHITKITPYEIIGLPRLNFKEGLWRSAIMIFGAPILDFPIYFVFFANIVSIGFVAYVLGRFQSYMRVNKKIELFKDNLYLATTVICIVQIGVASLIFRVLNHTLLINYLKEHFLFIIPLCLTCNLLYIAINRLRKEELLFGAAVSIAWLYWIIIVFKTLNLPFINYTILPNI